LAGNTVVLGFFKDEASADDAVESLKQWDKQEASVRLDAIGVLVLDDKGNVKAHKLGRRSIGKGAGIGLILAAVAPPTLLAGIVGGGVIGSFRHKGLGLNDGDRERLSSQLTNGRAAVGVLVAEDEADLVSSKLTELGRQPETHEVPQEAMAEAEAAAPEVEAATEAAGDDLTIIDGVGPAHANALRQSGVNTFAQLGELTSDDITERLAAGGSPLLAGHNANTWPRQAKLAAAGDWSALRRYIDSTK
jgi:predicted flap endonuclease-1-like 5' DNA nuclease